MTQKEFLGSPKLAPLLALACILAWAGAFPLIKLGYQEISLPRIADKLVFAGIRFTCAGVVALLFARILGRSFRVPTLSCYRNLLIFTLINIVLHYLFSYVGLSYITSSRGVIIDTMGSFIMILLSCWLFADDKLTFTKLWGCALGFAGVVIMNWQPGQQLFNDITFMGDGMILLNTICIAWGGIWAKLVSREMDVMVATAYSLFFGGASIWLIGTVAGGSIAFTSSTAIGITVALIGISAFSFSIYNQLLSYNPISKIAIFSSFMPIAGVIISGWLLQEPFVPRYYIAAIIVACGIYIINRGKK